MKVLLKKDVSTLGIKGDIVNVSDGYARNYLIPKGFAISATEGHLKTVETVLKDRTEKKNRELTLAHRKAEELAAKVIKLNVKAGESGKLFGSITSQDISRAVKDQWAVDLDKRKIHLDEPIKRLGTFAVPARIHPEITITIKVEVAPEA